MAFLTFDLPPLAYPPALGKARFPILDAPRTLGTLNCGEKTPSDVLSLFFFEPRL